MKELLDLARDPFTLAGFALFAILAGLLLLVSERRPWVRGAITYAAAVSLIGGFLLAYARGITRQQTPAELSLPGSPQVSSPTPQPALPQATESADQRSQGKRTLESRGRVGENGVLASVAGVRAPHDGRGVTGDDSRSDVSPEETGWGQVGGGGSGGEGAKTAAAGESELGVDGAPDTQIQVFDQIVDRLSQPTWVSEDRYQTGPALDGLFDLYERWRGGEQFEKIEDPGKLFVDQILEGAMKMLDPEDPDRAALMREAQRALEEGRWADAERLVRAAVGDPPPEN